MANLWSICRMEQVQRNGPLVKYGIFSGPEPEKIYETLEETVGAFLRIYHRRRHSDAYYGSWFSSITFNPPSTDIVLFSSSKKGSLMKEEKMWLVSPLSEKEKGQLIGYLAKAFEESAPPRASSQVEGILSNEQP